MFLYWLHKEHPAVAKEIEAQLLEKHGVKGSALPAAVESAVVVGAPDSPSADLLAAWLHARLKCPVRLRRSKESSGVIAVELTRASGVLELHRPVNGNAATLSTPGQPDRSDAECLAEELRRLDPDDVYQEALTVGLAGVGAARS